MEALFITEGGLKVGMGHLMRCLVLAEELRCAFPGISISFLTKKTADSCAQDYLAQRGYPCPFSEDMYELMDHKNIIIHDTPVFNIQELKRLKTQCDILILVGHGHKVSNTIDMVIDACIQEKYDNNNGKILRLFGSKYAIIHPAFTSNQPKIGSAINTVLISMGGSDPLALTPYIVQTLVDAFPFLLKVVLGPAFPATTKDQCLTKLKNPRIEYFISPVTLSETLHNIDMAICGGGITLFELAAAGIPTITIPEAYHQIKTALFFEQKGATKCLFRTLPKADKLCQPLKETIRFLSSETKLRVQMSKTGKILVDGQGIKRIIRALDRLVNCCRL